MRKKILPFFCILIIYNVHYNNGGYRNEKVYKVIVCSNIYFYYEWLW